MLLDDIQMTTTGSTMRATPNATLRVSTPRARRPPSISITLMITYRPAQKCELDPAPEKPPPEYPPPERPLPPPEPEEDGDQLAAEL